jgi:hypothetical protein
MPTNFNGLQDFKQQFKHAMIRAGVIPPDELFDDGKIKRFSTSANSSNEDGWYILHNSGEPHGSFGCDLRLIQSEWQYKPEILSSTEEQVKFSLDKFSLNGQSEAMKARMLDDVFVLDGMAILGQFTVFYAAPNIGKTLLVIWMIIHAINKKDIEAKDIFYINADDNHKGLTFKLLLAETHGFQMLAPGYADFESSKFLTYIKKIISDDNAKGKIIILDTLKKFVDIMRKDKSSDFGVVMRNFVSHGGTVIGLGHVNKHKGPDGKSIFGGTSDIVDDADCCYIIEEIQTTTKSKTIRFENTKARGDVYKTATFTYTNERVSDYQQLLDSIQTMSEAEAQALTQIDAMNKRIEANSEVIGVAISAISDGIVNKTDLVNHLKKTTTASKSQILAILEQHTGSNYHRGHRWTYMKGDKNAHIYSITPTDVEAKYRGSM